MSDPVLQRVFWEKMFVWKRQGKLAVLDWGGKQSRNQSMARLLELADDCYGLSDFGPLTLSTGDRPCSTDPSCITLGFSAAAGYADIAIPDHVCFGWPEGGVADYAETTWQVADAGAREPRNPGCGRIGADAGPDLPTQAAHWSSLLDVAEDCYSARLKILLHAGRPVLIQDRPWQEWYWDRLRPMQNFIPVRSDLADLADRLEWIRANPLQAAAIGHAGQALALTELTREAAVLRLAQTLERIAAGDATGYVTEDLRAPLEPVLERLGAFA